MHKKELQFGALRGFRGSLVSNAMGWGGGVTWGADGGILFGMNITLNGQSFEVPERSTVAGLIALRRQSGHLKTNAYAVELNREVCLRPAHETTALKAGDKVEVVVMVGGG
jgi:thiamine biosynthesis protein ThiS